MLPGQAEGAADLLLQTLSPSHFPFSEFSFRPGNRGLFGELLQPHAPKKPHKMRPIPGNPEIPGKNLTFFLFYIFFFFLERCAPREMRTPRWVGAPLCALQEGRLFEKEMNGKG